MGRFGMGGVGLGLGLRLIFVWGCFRKGGGEDGLGIVFGVRVLSGGVFWDGRVGLG